MNFPLLAHHVSEALLNGVLQGVLLTLLVAGILRCLPRINAATRHAVWFVCLLLVAALPVLHFAAGAGSAGTTVRDLPSAVISEMPVISPVDVSGDSPSVELEAPANAATVMPGILLAADPNPGPPASASGDFPGEGSPADFGPTHSDQAESSTGLSLPAARWWSVRLPGWIPVVLILSWLGVAACRLGSLAMECVRLRTLKRGAAPAGDRAESLFLRVRREMGVARRVELRIGPAEGVPLVAGFRYPAVVLPAGFVERNSPEQVSQVLRHELAHVHRWDDWSNLIQLGIRAALFFHPAVWWISERLSLDREIACDDHVLEATHQARTYALLLTDFAGRHCGRDLIAAPAVWNKKTQLKERIAMILDSKRNSSPRMAGTLTGLLAVVIAGVTGIVLQAAPRVALTPDVSVADVSVNEVTDVSVEASADVQWVAVNDSAPVTVAAGVDASEVVLLAVDSGEDSTGPRHKPSPPPSPEAPEVPASALPPVPPTPPTPSRVSRAITVYRSSGESGDGHPETVDVRGSRSGRNGSSTLEQRLDRLERLMEKLVAEGRGNGPVTPGSPDLKFNFDHKALAKLKDESRKLAQENFNGNLDGAGLAKIQESAKREAEKAAREVERAMAQVRRGQERVAKETAESLDRSGLDARQQLEIQRKALESTRHALEKELKTVERRLEQLEAEQEHVGEHAEERSKQETKPKHKEPTKADPTADNSPAAAPAP